MLIYFQWQIVANIPQIMDIHRSNFMYFSGSLFGTMNQQMPN